MIDAGKRGMPSAQEMMDEFPSVFDDHTGSNEW